MLILRLNFGPTFMLEEKQNEVHYPTIWLESKNKNELKESSRPLVDYPRL